MKRLLSVAALGLAAMVGGLAWADHHEGSKLMEEMKKCEVCKVMLDTPALMTSMTWETHKIDNGMLCVASVPKEMKKDFDAMHKKMMANVEKVKAAAKAGTKTELCSFCDGMGELEKSGAKFQEVNTKTGAVTLVTSDDEAVVKKIHEQADKAIAEQKKMDAEHSEAAAGR